MKLTRALLFSSSSFTRRNAHTHNPGGCVLYVRIDVPAAALIFLPFYFIFKKTA
jgi:hypothetical protein